LCGGITKKKKSPACENEEPAQVIMVFKNLNIERTKRYTNKENLHNTFAPTVTNCPYSDSEPRPHPTSHLKFTLPTLNDHTYTPYDERYCPSCLPIKIVGNELHTLLHFSHSSPLSHPAILSLTRALRIFDLCS